MLLLTVGNTNYRRVNGNVFSDLKLSGELNSMKVGCWVRRGLLEKVSPQLLINLHLLTLTLEVTRWVATLPAVLGCFLSFSHSVFLLCLRSGGALNQRYPGVPQRNWFV